MKQNMRIDRLGTAVFPSPYQAFPVFWDKRAMGRRATGAMGVPAGCGR